MSNRSRRHRSPQPKGRRRALLIGCNYEGQRGALRGCINDTKALSGLLLSQYGWRREDMRILTDHTRDCLPTKENIISACRWLVHDARPGDVFFFSFSGHGAQQVDPNGYEEDGMNETLLPLDFQRAGMITDDTLASVLVRDLPSGAKLLAILDACHSGTGLDLPFQWNGYSWKEDTNPFHTVGDVQMFSGCEDHDTSADSSGGGAAGGAMTTAFVTVLKENPSPTYPELLANLRRVLRHRGFKQVPVLTASQAFSFQRHFMLDDACPNTNKQLGRIFRKKFKPSPSAKAQKFMNEMGIANMAVGAMAAYGASSMCCDLINLFLGGGDDDD